MAAIFSWRFFLFIELKKIHQRIKNDTQFNRISMKEVEMYLVFFNYVFSRRVIFVTNNFAVVIF